MGRGHVSWPGSCVPGRYTVQTIIRKRIIQQICPKDVHKYLSAGNPVMVEQFMTTANWAALLTDPFLCSYEAPCLKCFSTKNVNNITLSFKFISRYIKTVSLLNNTKLCDVVDHIQIPLSLRYRTVHTQRGLLQLILYNLLDKYSKNNFLEFTFMI